MYSNTDRASKRYKATSGPLLLAVACIHFPKTRSVMTAIALKPKFAQPRKFGLTPGSI